MAAAVKGVLLHSWMVYLNERLGKDVVIKGIQKLEPSDRALLGTGVFLAASWYPYEALHGLRSLTRLLVPNADKNLAIEIGRSMAWHSFGDLARSMGAGDPIEKVKSLTRLSDGHFRDARAIETEVTGANSCIVRYRYASGVTPTHAICSSLTGFWTCVLEMVGATRIVASHGKCILKGEPVCEFSFSWVSTNSVARSSANTRAILNDMR